MSVASGCWSRPTPQRRPGTAPAADPFYKDLSSAVLAAAQRGVVLPPRSLAAKTIRTKLAERDEFIESTE
jgi:hypothetical protein